MDGDIWCFLSHSLLYNMYTSGYPRNSKILLLLKGCWDHACIMRTSWGRRILPGRGGLASSWWHLAAHGAYSCRFEQTSTMGLGSMLDPQLWRRAREVTTWWLWPSQRCPAAGSCQNTTMSFLPCERGGIEKCRPGPRATWTQRSRCRFQFS